MAVPASAAQVDMYAASIEFARYEVKNLQHVPLRRAINRGSKRIASLLGGKEARIFHAHILIIWRSPVIDKGR